MADEKQSAKSTISEMRQQMEKLQINHENTVREKAEAFTRVQNEIQRLLDEAEKKLELVPCSC